MHFLCFLSIYYTQKTQKKYESTSSAVGRVPVCTSKIRCSIPENVKAVMLQLMLPNFYANYAIFMHYLCISYEQFMCLCSFYVAFMHTLCNLYRFMQVLGRFMQFYVPLPVHKICTKDFVCIEFIYTALNLHKTA